MADLLINIDVSDLEKGIQFYSDGLGLQLRRHLGPDVAALEGASCPVFLICRAAGTRPFLGAPSTLEFQRHWTPVHLDFVVTDLEAAVRRAESSGATQERQIREPEWGRYLVMADPFGNGFCMLQFKGRGYAEIA